MDEQPSNNLIGSTWALYILGVLRDTWPQRQSFHHMSVAEVTDLNCGWDTEDIFDDLLRWLQNEGFIRLGPISNDTYLDVELTAKGFEILGRTLVLNHEGVGGKLKEIAKGGASEAGRAAIAETVGIIFGAAARHFTGS